jgi:hypothetical protein
MRGGILMKIKIEKFLKNKKSVCIASAILVIIIMAGIGIGINMSGTADRNRASKLSKMATKEINDIKKSTPNMDRDTFIEVNEKVIVGFIKISELKMEYPVLNTYNRKNYDSSLCRVGTGMPWDTVGMIVYGIDSFTSPMKQMKYGTSMIFEDLAGKKYKYIYKKDSDRKAIDNGIKICTVDKDGNEKETYQFIPEN